jgi:Asp-tRNA(Asn)/Glu-tRNA(Gln) amidotransferase A subunit family amidase
MRDLLPRDEAERRNRECKRRYYETNRDMLREKAKAARAADPNYNQKRKEQYRAKIQELIDEGLYRPAKRGRKALYHTPEEAMEAKRLQMQASRARRAERLAAATALLNQRRLGEPLSEESDLYDSS